MGLCIHSSTHYVIPVWEEKQNVQTSFVRMLSTLAVSCLQLQILVCNRKKKEAQQKMMGESLAISPKKYFSGLLLEPQA
jgi:hypothetical protein